MIIIFINKSISVYKYVTNILNGLRVDKLDILWNLSVQLPGVTSKLLKHLRMCSNFLPDIVAEKAGW